MEMNQIRFFVAVARTLHFTRAAEECNVSQPSLTRAIKQLEDELGGDLFQRGRPQQLTELGKRMRPLLTQCYECALGARSLAASFRKRGAGVLTMALSHTIELSLFIALLTELQAKLGGFELRMLRGSQEDVGELLSKGDADLAIAAGPGDARHRLDSWPLFTEGFQLIVNAGHRLADRPFIDIADLRQERFLGRPYCEQAERLAALLRNNGIELDRGYDIASEHDLMALLHANVGVAIVPHSIAIPDALRRVAVNGLDLRRVVQLHGIAGRPGGALAAEVMRSLRAADWSRYDMPHVLRGDRPAGRRPHAAREPIIHRDVELGRSGAVSRRRPAGARSADAERGTVVGAISVARARSKQDHSANSKHIQEA
jgi:DNA-binding transcriptional LysR family regulator